MIDRFSTAVIGAFVTSLFHWVVPLKVGCRSALMLLCLLILGIHASGIGLTIPVDVVMVKSDLNRFFGTACVPMRIRIIKLCFIPKRVERALKRRRSGYGQVGYLGHVP